MAISLISEPQLYQPVNNPIQFVFDSTNKNSCDFCYIADVYVNGNFIVSLKSFPDGTNGYGTFRLERVLKDYLSHDVHNDLIGFDNNPNSIITYSVEIIERANSQANCTGDVVDSAVLYTSSDKHAWNGALSYRDYSLFNYQEYVAINALTSTPLTSGRSLTVRENIDFVLSVLQWDNGGASTIDALKIETFDVNNNSLGTFTIDNTITAISAAEDLCLSIGVGTHQLNGATLSTGSQPVIDSDVDHYTVWFIESGGAQTTHQITFYIDRECNDYRKFPIYWLNRLGGIDSYTFILNHSRSVDISRKEYHRPLPAQYAQGDRGISILNVEAHERFTLNSTWMTEAEAEWIEELFTSPVVFMQDREGTVFNVTSVVHVGGFAKFFIDYNGVLPDGTRFSYSVTNGGIIGMADTGTGEITSFSGGGYVTDVVSSINTGALITGTFSLLDYDTTPLVVTSPIYEEKRKDTMRLIRYSIDIKPANSVNVQ